MRTADDPSHHPSLPFFALTTLKGRSMHKINSLSRISTYSIFTVLGMKNISKILFQERRALERLHLQPAEFPSQGNPALTSTSQPGEADAEDGAGGDLRSKNLVRFLGMKDGVTPSIAMQGSLSSSPVDGDFAALRDSPGSNRYKAPSIATRTCSLNDPQAESPKGRKGALVKMATLTNEACSNSKRF